MARQLRTLLAIAFLAGIALLPQAAFAGSYSPDGHWIVFRVRSNGVFQLWKMNHEGGERRLIGTFPFAPRFIDWGTYP